MINVLSFGAIGDSSTDNTAALQAAVNSLYATGGEVYFPTGNYYFGESASGAGLVISTAGISLVGERVSGGSGSGVILTLQSTFSVIDGIHVVAPNFKMSDIALSGHKALTSSAYNLLTIFPSSGDCVIEDCSIQDGYNHVLLSSCQNVIFSRCQFRGIYVPSTGYVSNFHLHTIGSPLAIAANVTLRDCNIGSGSSNGMSLIGTTAIIMDEYTQALTLDNVTVDSGGNGFRAQVSSPGGQWPNGIRMKGFGIDQIDGQAVWFAQAQNVQMTNCPIEGGGIGNTETAPGVGLPTLQIDSTVANFLSTNCVFSGSIEDGVLIAGRNVGLFNCATGGNSRDSVTLSPPAPPPVFYPQIHLEASAENVAIIGGQAGPLGSGVNLANYSVEIDQGATRIRIVGLDASQNPLSNVDLGGSFDLVAADGIFVFDGESRVRASNLQRLNHSTELLAADFYITCSLDASMLTAGSRYPLAIIGNQAFWVIGVACSFMGTGSSHNCEFRVYDGSVSIFDKTITINGNFYTALTTPALIGGSAATQELSLDIVSASASATSLLVTLSCQSIS